MSRAAPPRPRLTIGIPTYNRAPILEATLERLAGVCEPDVEVVVTDNASTDATPNVIERFRHRFGAFRTIRHAENLGPWRNICSAICQARGKYYYSLCDDDILHYAGITNATNILDAEPGVAAVFGAYEEWDQVNHRVLETFRLVETRTDFNRGERMPIFQQFPLLWYPVARTALQQRYFSYDLDCDPYWLLVGAMLEHGSLAVVPDIFYKHAHTEGRGETALAEPQHQDRHRAGYETFLGRYGALSPTDVALFVSARSTPTYKQGLRFSLLKGELSRARLYLLRARAYGLVSEEAVISWEKDCMVPLLAERLLDSIKLSPQIREVLFDNDERLHHVAAVVASTGRYTVLGLKHTLPTVGLTTEWLKESQFLVTFDYPQEDAEGHRPDAGQHRALTDIMSYCRLTDNDFAFWLPPQRV